MSLFFKKSAWKFVGQIVSSNEMYEIRRRKCIFQLKEQGGHSALKSLNCPWIVLGLSLNFHSFSQGLEKNIFFAKNVLEFLEILVYYSVCPLVCPLVSWFLHL